MSTNKLTPSVQNQLLLTPSLGHISLSSYDTKSIGNLHPPAKINACFKTRNGLILILLSSCQFVFTYLNFTLKLWLMKRALPSANSGLELFLYFSSRYCNSFSLLDSLSSVLIATEPYLVSLLHQLLHHLLW